MLDWIKGLFQSVIDYEEMSRLSDRDLADIGLRRVHTKILKLH